MLNTNNTYKYLIILKGDFINKDNYESKDKLVKNSGNNIKESKFNEIIEENSETVIGATIGSCVSGPVGKILNNKFSE